MPEVKESSLAHSAHVVTGNQVVIRLPPPYLLSTIINGHAYIKVVIRCDGCPLGCLRLVPWHSMLAPLAFVFTLFAIIYVFVTLSLIVSKLIHIIVIK